jgi:hypothetical protein
MKFPENLPLIGSKIELIQIPSVTLPQSTCYYINLGGVREGVGKKIN